MKNKLAIIVPFILIVGCNSNSSTDNTQASTQLVKHTIYTIHKVDCGDDDSKSDSTFLFDSNKVTVSICPVCYGDYVFNDTIDSCNIYAHRNRNVIITIKSSKEKKVTITKDFLTKSIKDQNFANNFISFTSIDSIAMGEKKIIFSTLIGVYAIYFSVDINGEVKFIKEDIADVGE